MDLTGKIRGMILSVVLLIIALFLFPIVVDSTFDANNDNITDSFPGCVVAAGATDVVLTQDLVDDNVIYVTNITATGAGAVPVANTYTPATNTLNVTGLGVDTPQDLTVTYSYSVVDDYNGVEGVLRLTPLLTVIGLVLVAIINGIWVLKMKN